MEYVINEFNTTHRDINFIEPIIDSTKHLSHFILKL